MRAAYGAVVFPVLPPTNPKFDPDFQARFDAHRADPLRSRWDTADFAG